MSGLVLRLCECCVGLLVKAANNIFQSAGHLSGQRPVLTWQGNILVGRNKTKEKMKRRTNKLKQKIKNLLLQNLELLILIVWGPARVNSDKRHDPKSSDRA